MATHAGNTTDEFAAILRDGPADISIDNLTVTDERMKLVDSVALRNRSSTRQRPRGRARNGA